MLNILDSRDKCRKPGFLRGNIYTSCISMVLLDHFENKSNTFLPLSSSPSPCAINAMVPCPSWEHYILYFVKIRILNIFLGVYPQGQGQRENPLFLFWSCPLFWKTTLKAKCYTLKTGEISNISDKAVLSYLLPLQEFSIVVKHDDSRLRCIGCKKIDNSLLIPLKLMMT